MRSQITKRLKISYGHLLTNYVGNCNRDHGHNALIEITVSGEIQPVLDDQGNKNSQAGMVRDFGEVKTIINEVLGKWDHRFLACGDEWNYVSMLKHNPDRADNFVVLGVPTTAENLAKIVLSQVQRELHGKIDADLVVELVRWWETDDNYAEYTQGSRRD